MENKLSDLLKTVRSERKSSLREFAEFIGISHTYLNKLERGVDPRTGKEVTPTIETIIKISQALSIPLFEFLYICDYKLDSESIENQNVPIEINYSFNTFCLTLLSGKNFVLNSKEISKEEIESLVYSLKETFEEFIKKCEIKK